MKVSKVGQVRLSKAIRFDKNGIVCDSSDIDVERYKDLVLLDYDETGHLAPAPCEDVDVEKVKAIVSQYDETRLIPRATSLRRPT